MELRRAAGPQLCSAHEQGSSLSQQLVASADKPEQGWKRGSFISSLLTRSCGAERLNNPVVTALGHPQSLSQSSEMISKLLSPCFDHSHRLSHGSREGSGVWKLPAPSATKQQSTGKGREGECSHLSSPFSPAGLSKLPGLLTPAVSLGTTEGCCGSEMLFKNTLIGVVLPVSTGAIPRPGENPFLFSSFFFFLMLLYNKIPFTRVTYLHWEILITNPIKFNSFAQIESSQHVILSGEQIERVYF